MEYKLGKTCFESVLLSVCGYGLVSSLRSCANIRYPFDDISKPYIHIRAFGDYFFTKIIISL